MNICVFCGSSTSIGEPYISAMARLGKAIASHGHDLVFGGYDTGLMGAVAHGVADAGGKVHGVVPCSVDRFSSRMVFECDELFEVVDISARKAKMMELADAYISAPGGFGTFDELYEALVDEKLATRANKPIALYNIEGFYDVFEEYVDKMFAGNFISESDAHRYFMGTDSDSIVEEIERRAR